MNDTPFHYDLIADIHGRHDKLEALMARLGYHHDGTGFVPYPANAPPVFFGHYFKPADAALHPERPNVACLDHSAAKDGPLVAYRWNGEAAINPNHYLTHA